MMIYKEYDFKIIQSPGDEIRDVRIMATDYAVARQRLGDMYQPYSIIDHIENQLSNNNASP